MKKQIFFSLAIFFLLGNLTLHATDGVVINGVMWATRNVASPGTFAANPEDAGMFYQWNSKVGWPSTGDMGTITASNGATTWNANWEGGYTNPSSYDTWTKTNDPSPAGYHVPNSYDFYRLFDTNYVSRSWISQNAVYGMKFTDIASGNSIFLPAVGERGLIDGKFENSFTQGNYWSNEGYDDMYIGSKAYYRIIDSSGIFSDDIRRSYAFSLRSVSDIKVAVDNTTIQSFKVYVNNGKAVLSALPVGDMLSVYTLQSTLIYSEKINTTEQTIDLPVRGVYVVKVGNMCEKIIY